MKKFWSLFALIMLTVSAVTIVSCSKDDDDDSGDFMDGVWYGTVTVSSNGYSASGSVWMECEDGEGEMNCYISGYGDFMDGDFTYTVDDETITIYPDGKEKYAQEYTYTYNEKKGCLEMYRTYRENGSTFTVTFSLYKEDDDDDYDYDYYDYDDYSYRY